jgi:hypothetical protein
MRRLLVPLTLAMSVFALSASTALAAAPEGAQKASLYDIVGKEGNCTTGFPAVGATHGFVVLNTPGDESVVTGEVSLKRGSPNTTYNVFLYQDIILCNFALVATLQTNGQGNGNAHFEVPRNPVATDFFVAVLHKSPPISEFGSPAVELD